MLIPQSRMPIYPAPWDSTTDIVNATKRCCAMAEKNTEWFFCKRTAKPRPHIRRRDGWLTVRHCNPLWLPSCPSSIDFDDFHTNTSLTAHRWIQSHWRFQWMPKLISITSRVSHRVRSRATAFRFNLRIIPEHITVPVLLQCSPCSTWQGFLRLGLLRV